MQSKITNTCKLNDPLKQGHRKMNNKGGSYSCIHVLHNLFLFKSIVFLVFEHEYMNMIIMSPPPLIINLHTTML